MKRRRRRACPSLPLLVLSAAVVSLFFALAAIAGADNAAELPETTIATYAERVTQDTPVAATPEETPAPYIPNETEVEMLAACFLLNTSSLRATENETTSARSIAAAFIGNGR